MNPISLTPAERRQFLRSAFHADVDIASAGRVYPARLLDLSLKGALVEQDGAWPVQVGQTCRFRLELVPGTAIMMDTTVAHVRDSQVGLQCDHIDLDSITHLRRLVELNAGAPDLLERELALLVGAA